MSLVFQPKHAKGTDEPVVATEAAYVLGKGELAPDLAIASQRYKDWQKSEELKLKNKKVGGFCSCVIFAKALTGYNSPVGAARNWPKNTTEPTVGGVVVTRESRVGHVAVITAIDGESFTIVEGNYLRCRKTIRTLNKSNPVILGYWQKTNE